MSTKRYFAISSLPSTVQRCICPVEGRTPRLAVYGPRSIVTNNRKTRDSAPIRRRRDASGAFATLDEPIISRFGPQDVSSIATINSSDSSISLEEDVSPEDIVAHHPIEILDEHIKNGTLTRPLATKYLQSLQDQLKTLPIPISRRLVEEASAGQKILQWLWNQHIDMQPKDLSLITMTTDFLLAEDREKLLWDWIRQRSPKSFSNSNENKKTIPIHEQYRWRSQAILALAIAKSRDVHGSLDAAITVCSTAVRARKNGLYINYTSAIMYIRRQLTSSVPNDLSKPKYPLTSPEKWQEFYNLLSTASGQNAREQQAALWLYHRQTPDPIPFFDFLKEVMRDEGHSLRKVDKQGNVDYFHVLCLRCAELFRGEGRAEHGEWVLEVAGVLFSKRTKWQRRR